MTKEELKNRAKEFVSKIASGTSQEMEYYANILVEFANETTKELEKENAELKEQLNKDCDSAWDDGFNCSEKARLEQLAEAKELIDELKSSLSVVGECGEEECELLDRADQFLCEVSK